MDGILNLAPQIEEISNRLREDLLRFNDLIQLYQEFLRNQAKGE